MRFVLIDANRAWDKLVGFFPDAASCDAAALAYFIMTDELGGPVCLALSGGWPA